MSINGECGMDLISWKFIRSSFRINVTNIDVVISDFVAVHIQDYSVVNSYANSKERFRGRQGQVQNRALNDQPI